MAKKSKSPQGDILEEKYKGASAAVAAAGEAYYAHYWMALVGLAGGMLGTAIFRNSISKQITNLREIAGGWVGSETAATRLTGKTIHGIFGTGKGHLKDEFDTANRMIGEVAKDDTLSALQRKIKIDVLEHGVEHIKTKERGFGYWLLSHTLYKIPGVRSKVSEVKDIDTVVAAGGLLGAFGFFIAPWLYAVKGVHNARQGKEQFSRSKEEIKELREDLSFVEQKNTELRQELRNTKEQSLHITKDDTPAVRETSVAASGELPKRKDDQSTQKDEGRGEEHTKHTHHSERHKTHAESHGAHIRAEQAAAKETAAALA